MTAGDYLLCRNLTMNSSNAAGYSAWVLYKLRVTDTPWGRQAMAESARRSWLDRFMRLL
jgi:hypothetical protein